MRIISGAAVPLHTFEAAISILMAAIALVVISIYPNLQNAINRGKQRRMMSDMRSMGEAINAYHLDFGGYPPGKSTVEEIQKDLEGYMDKVPLQDEWGNKYLYRSDGSTYYTILSWGKDRVMDNTSIYQGLVTSYSNDIVFSNGLFVSFPEILE